MTATEKNVKIDTDIAYQLKVDSAAIEFNDDANLSDSIKSEQILNIV